MILEDIKEEIKVEEKKIDGIETEIETEGIVGIEDQDQKKETEKINATKIADKGLSQEILLWKGNSWSNNGTRITTKIDEDLLLFYCDVQNQYF